MTAAFDTNILFYACDKEEPDRLRIAQSFLADSKDAVLLWQVSCEFIAASRKLAHQGFTKKHAWDRLAELMKFQPLVLPNANVLEHARTLHVDHGCSLWDGLIYAACLEAGVDTLYSEDLPGCPIPGLKVVNPFAAE